MARRSVEQIARTKATEPPHPTTGRTQPSLRPAPDNWLHTTIATPRTRQLVAHTRQCAAGPYGWSMGDLAHAPPQGLTCASKGAGHHPSGLSAPHLAHSAVHFASIAPFSAIFTEVDCVLGQTPNTAPHRHTAGPHIATPRTRQLVAHNHRYAPHPTTGCTHPSMRSWAL